MSDKKDFFNGCLNGNWVEFEVKETKTNAVSDEDGVVAKATNRKDLETLLAELSEIKSSFERIEDNRIRLNNLMKFYKGDSILINTF